MASKDKDSAEHTVDVPSVESFAVAKETEPEEVAPGDDPGAVITSEAPPFDPEETQNIVFVPEEPEEEPAPKKSKGD